MDCFIYRLVLCIIDLVFDSEVNLANLLKIRVKMMDLRTGVVHPFKLAHPLLA